MNRGENDAVICRPWTELPYGPLGISLFPTGFVDKARILVGHDVHAVPGKRDFSTGMFADVEQTVLKVRPLGRDIPEVVQPDQKTLPGLIDGGLPIAGSVVNLQR